MCCDPSMRFNSTLWAAFALVLVAAAPARAQQSIPPIWQNNGTRLCAAYTANFLGGGLTCSGGVVSIPSSTGTVSSISCTTPAVCTPDPLTTTGTISIAANPGFTGTATVTVGLDRNVAGTLGLGTTTANAISIGGSGINATFGGAALLGGILDRSTAAALSIGTVNATGVTIATTSTTTTVKGDLDMASTTDNNFTHTFSSSTNTAAAQTITSTNAAASGTIGTAALKFALAGTATSGTNTVYGITFPPVTAIASNSFVGIDFQAANNYNTFLNTPTIMITGAGAITGATGVSLTTGSNLVVGSNTLTTTDQLDASKLLIASQAANDLLYASSTTAWTRLTNGSTGQVLTATTGSAPSWAAATGATPTGWFGDGSDGSVTISANANLTANKYYSALTVNASTTLGNTNFIIYCTGTATINGTIRNLVSLTQQAAVGANVLSTGADGGNGSTGTGVDGSSVSADGNGGAGGAGGNGTSGNGGAGGTVTAPPANRGSRVVSLPNAATLVDVSASGTSAALDVYPVRGGGGGGGGGGDGTNAGGKGGCGCGNVIVAATTITIGGGGAITCDGNNGTAASAGNAGGGGGGGGGTLVLIYHTLTGAGTANGGSGGAKSGTGTNGSGGSAGLYIPCQL